MSPKLRSFAMDLRMLGTTGYRVVAWAYCLIILDHIFVTSSSSVRVGVGAADVKPISQSLELQCPPCNKLHCSPRNVRRLRCKGGITRGVCNCCPVCAKLQGESCGGQWNFLGKCDRGLRCIPDESPRNDITEILTMADRKKTWIPQGKCRRALSYGNGYDQMDQPMPAYCRPKCNPEYCNNNPRAICSAIDNAEKTHSCHGDCQHTSCRACHYVKNDEGCGKCSKDDFNCIKAFGRCIKQEFCSRRKFPCKSNMIQPGLKFKCVVPDCLNP